jgi:uncharacterized protein YecE (DUF72 family)
VAGTLYLGTSGYAYPQWTGAFYPPDLRSGKMLSHYAGRFDSVEINYTFRREASDRTLAAWCEQTPEEFRFALKAHASITHWLRLRDAGELARSFVERARRLGDRLGAVLFQCPPNLRFDRDVAISFLSALPPGVRYAMELRHPSWDDARGLLAEHGVAWCTADVEQRPAGPPSWEPFGYLRLRRQAYGEEDLRAWADRIADALAMGRDVYCYFKHEDAAGPTYVERTAELVAARS